MASLQRAYKAYVRDFKLSRPFNPFCQRYPFALLQDHLQHDTCIFHSTRLLTASFFS